TTSDPARDPDRGLPGATRNFYSISGWEISRNWRGAAPPVAVHFPGTDTPSIRTAEPMRTLTPRLLLLAALWLPQASGLHAADLRDPAFVARAQEGFVHIFNQDYAPARALFLGLEREYPGHPAPPLYLASIRWLEE